MSTGIVGTSCGSAALQWPLVASHSCTGLLVTFPDAAVNPAGLESLMMGGGKLLAHEFLYCVARIIVGIGLSGFKD